jgi:hypothetical protein
MVVLAPTQNPRQASELLEIRHTSMVDAVCVDQRNVAERNAQVQLMGRIYQEAHGVVVWLGPADDLVSTVVSRLQYDVAQHRDFEYHGLADLMLNRKTISPGSKANEASSSEIVTFFSGMCRKSYWTRRWIVQELVLAKTIVLIFGEQELPWDALLMTLRRFQAEREDFRKHNASSALAVKRALRPIIAIQKTTAATIWAQRDSAMRGDANPKTLSTLLELYRPLQCQSFHDKVYALASLATYDNVAIDYSISAAELVSRVWTSVIPRRSRKPFSSTWRNLAADCEFNIEANPAPQSSANSQNQPQITPVRFPRRHQFRITNIRNWKHISTSSGESGTLKLKRFSSVMDRGTGRRPTPRFFVSTVSWNIPLYT